MKRAADLTRDELEALVNSIQEALWLTWDYELDDEAWECAKEWNYDTLDVVGGVMSQFNLGPSGTDCTSTTCETSHAHQDATQRPPSERK